jgi:hypothetical protein
MKLILFLSFILVTTTGFAQQVVNFSYGKRGTDGYEAFSFSVKNNVRAEIFYYYGKDETEVKLTYAGRSLMKNRPCFKVRFANGYELMIAPKEQSLKIMDSDESYDETFQWEYEVDAYCDICARDETEAVVFIKQYFM